MNLKAQLLAEQSRANVDFIVGAVENDELYFSQLMEMVFSDDKILPQRATWVIEALTDKYLYLIYKYIPSIIQKLEKNQHQGVKRGMLRIISHSPLPDKNIDILINKCFNWINDPNETVSVRVHSMQILYNISEKIPGIKFELKAIIEHHYDSSTVGFKTRGKKILRKIDKEIENSIF